MEIRLAYAKDFRNLHLQESRLTRRREKEMVDSAPSKPTQSTRNRRTHESRPSLPERECLVALRLRRAAVQRCSAWNKNFVAAGLVVFCSSSFWFTFFWGVGESRHKRCRRCQLYMATSKLSVRLPPYCHALRRYFSLQTWTFS
jgi:hypothetical protein